MTKTIFQPTPEWLEANGFIHYNETEWYYELYIHPVGIELICETGEFLLENNKSVYPQSEQDVLNLISLLTP